LIEICPRGRSVHEQPECLDLRWRPLVAEDHGDLIDPELARSLQAQMPVDDFAVAAGKHRNLEAKFTDRTAHPVDGSVVLAWVARIFNEPVDGPKLDVLKCLGSGHMRVPKLNWEIFRKLRPRRRPGELKLCLGL